MILQHKHIMKIEYMMGIGFFSPDYVWNYPVSRYVSLDSDINSFKMGTL